MAIKLMHNAVSLKHEATNKYLPIGVFTSDGDKTITEINKFAQETKTETINAIEDKKNKTLKSIPDDYKTLDAAVKKTLTSEKLTELPELKTPLDEVKQAITTTGNKVKQEVTDTGTQNIKAINAAGESVKNSLPSAYTELETRVDELVSVNSNLSLLSGNYMKLTGNRNTFNWTIGNDTTESSDGTTSILKTGKKIWSEYIRVDSVQDFNVITRGVKLTIAYYDYRYTFLGYRNVEFSSGTIEKIALYATNKFNQNDGYFRLIVGKTNNSNITQSQIIDIAKLIYIENCYGNNLITNYSTINGTSLTDDMYAGYIITNVGAGNTVYLGEEEDIAGYSYKVVSCSAGNEFIITGTTQNDECRLWAFLDANNILLSVADSKASVTKLKITAPTNAKKLVVNFRTGYNTELYKLDDTSVQKLASNIIKQMFHFDSNGDLSVTIDGVTHTYTKKS